MSMKKKEEEEIMTLRKYFGFMNGTMSDNGSTVNKPSAGVKRRKTYFNNRNKDKIQVTKRSTKKLKK